MIKVFISFSCSTDTVCVLSVSRTNSCRAEIPLRINTQPKDEFPLVAPNI